MWPWEHLAVAYGLTARRGERELGGAFSIAYLSHLLADVIDPWLRGRALEPRAVLWPVSSPLRTTTGD